MTEGEEEQVHREKTALQAQHAEALRLCGLCLDDLKKVEGDRPVMVTVRLAYDLSVLKQHLCDLHAELEDMEVSPDQSPKRECVACGLIQPATNTVCSDCGQTRDLVRKPEAITEEMAARGLEKAFEIKQQEDY